MKVNPIQLPIPSWVPELVVEYIGAEHASDIVRTYRDALQEGLKEEALQEGENDYFDDLLDDCFITLVNHSHWIVCHGTMVQLSETVLADIASDYLPLACDPRMKGVWRELSKRRKHDGGFLYPAEQPSSEANSEARQNAAMFELFEAMLECRSHCRETMTQGQRSRLLAKADELERDAVLMFRWSGGKDWERYQTLKTAAQVYRDHVSEIDVASSETAFERKHDGRGRWVATTISNKFRKLFGSPMYGLTATITSVVLARGISRELDPRTVRYWCDPCS
jgi:hypothetical protein